MFYDYLLTFDDEVRRQSSNPLRLHLLTCRSIRFDMFGEAERHGVRSVICTNHAGRSDVQSRGSLVSLHLGASPRISRFGEPLIELVLLDRTGSFSQGISSLGFITWVARRNPRLVRKQNAFALEQAVLNLF